MVGVTKGVPVEVIRQAIALGLTDLGENRVQEAREKQIALGSGLRAAGNGPEPGALSHQRIRWHLIGHLQRNKAKHAVELFDMIHSVDSAALIHDVERHAAQRQRRVEAFIQVNVSGEATKYGCRPDEIEPLAKVLQQSEHMLLKGLMTLAPFSDNPEDARPVFRHVRLLRDDLQRQLAHASPVTSHQSLLLSMGMSQDFEVAIEEGADLVRTGTAIFGERP